MIAIDANIASSAGEASTARQGQVAYTCLRQWQESDHVMVLVPGLLAEWNVARSGNPHSKQILAAQVARGKVLQTDQPGMHDVQAALDKAKLQPSMRQAIDHDIHLLESARVGAMLVLSLDGKIRKHLRRASSQLRPIFPDLRWSNPEKEASTLDELMRDTKTPADSAPRLFPADPA